MPTCSRPWAPSRACGSCGCCCPRIREGLVVGDIGDRAGASPNSTLSHHLEKLKNEDLVNVRREGTFLWYSANAAALQELLRFLYAECCTRNQAIEPQKIVCRRLNERNHHVRTERCEGSRPREVRPGRVARRAGPAATAAAAARAPAPTSDAATRSPPTCTTPRRPATYRKTALLASLGCGNPTALAELKPGETVLDLGSGGGIDVLLSARRVGPTGKAYGLDMTDEMLALAEENKRKSGLANVAVPQGRDREHPAAGQLGRRDHLQLRHQPLGRQGPVLREAFRVLKPGGRFAVSDVVVRGEVPPRSARAWNCGSGCVAGALSENEYLAKLAAAGFRRHRHRGHARLRQRRCARLPGRPKASTPTPSRSEVDGKFVSAFIRAVKPKPCCAAGCCSR